MDGEGWCVARHTAGATGSRFVGVVYLSRETVATIAYVNGAMGREGETSRLHF